MKKILVAIDGSDHAWRALDYAGKLAKALGEELLVYSVLKPNESAALLAKYDMEDPLPPHEAEGLDEIGNKLLDEARERATSGVKTTFELGVGYPPEMIVAKAKKARVESIVMGTRGMSGIKEMLLGSVSNYVLQYATVPVVIIK